MKSVLSRKRKDITKDHKALTEAELASENIARNESEADTQKTDDTTLNSASDQMNVRSNLSEPGESIAKTANQMPSSYKKYVFVYLGVAIIIVVVCLLSVWRHHRPVDHTPGPTNTALVKQPVIKSKPITPPSPKPGYVIFNTPQQLSNLNFFSNTAALFGTNCTGNQTTNCPPLVTSSQINYAQIGVTPLKQPIVVAYNYSLFESSFSYIAIETTQGHYEIIGQMGYDLDPLNSGDQSTISSLKSSLNSNVSLDTADSIQPLTFPQTVVVKGEALTLPDYTGPVGYFIPGLTNIRATYYGPVKLSQVSKIGSSGDVTYYEVAAESQPTYNVEEIYAVVGGVYATPYLSIDPLTNATAPSIQWNDSSLNGKTYKSATAGCGSADGYVVANGIDPSQLLNAGVGPDGETIYQLSPSSALFNTYYNDNYSGNLSVASFQAAHAVIVAKNAFGEYVVYERTDMFQAGGCGKPVIYLYPQKPTEVNVKIGANITTSDPSYKENGWENILALPSGALSYDGQSYTSLYWEGTGLGTYPLITSGTVVPKSKAVETILEQLADQGIDKQESQAFISYWGPKLPSTPYIRLTWLGTNQMNELAPLNITPKPQTIIRVFLDFQGLNTPISIKSQSFNKPTRKGFTVVEWGGLLRY